MSEENEESRGAMVPALSGQLAPPPAEELELEDQLAARGMRPDVVMLRVRSERIVRSMRAKNIDQHQELAEKYAASREELGALEITDDEKAAATAILNGEKV